MTRNICGAKCRSRSGLPCSKLGMKNGRCAMHGGCTYKIEKHGMDTLRAKKQRIKAHVFLKEIKEMNSRIDDVLTGGNKKIKNV